MAFSRDQVDNSIKPVSDEKLSDEQYRNRLDKHTKVEKDALKETDLKIGDDVYLKVDKSKHRGREKYKITKMFDRNHEKFAVIQKSNTKFMAKEYEVKIAEIFPVLNKRHLNNQIAHNDDKHLESETGSSIATDDQHSNLDEKQTNTKEAVAEISTSRPSQRKAAAAANKRFKIRAVNTILKKSENQQKLPLHAWNYNDWVALNEACDLVVLPAAP